MDEQQQRQEKETEALVDMFATEGWKIFMASITEIEELSTKSAPDNAATNDQWQYARGMIHQLRKIMNYETFINLAAEQATAPELFEEDPDVDII